jgi:hypothetical protein
MTEQDILENLESQLIGFKGDAAKHGYTDIAVMIVKFIALTRDKLTDLKEAAE